MESIEEFFIPDREFTLIPLWFWNDELSEEELARQIAGFEAHGVYGFGIHIRIGVPHDFEWMSDRMMELVRFAVEEAKRRNMTVVLFDEGMYPSGSSCGQVAASNPDHQVRCLDCKDLVDGERPALDSDENLVAVAKRQNGTSVAVFDRKLRGVIRGIHYIEEGPAEERPLAGDILNPDAVASFIRLVYDRLYECVGEYFGDTILGIFTDEPSFMAKSFAGEGHLPDRQNARPGTTNILNHVSNILGYDFTPHLPALWYDDEPEAEHYRQEYINALTRRLDETYYRPLSKWCKAHGVALMGHPLEPDELSTQRFLDIPGQDVIARKILPGASALEGPESTQAKCASSAMIHLGRRRNSNECFGDYGHELTYDEMKFITDWLFVRGTNMLMPHAFYYSMRGCRRDERPPDVGPNSPWWNDYKNYADYCSRMSWLNTDSQHICDVTILASPSHAPWTAAKVCFQNQRDFNYLEMAHLSEDAIIDDTGIHIAAMNYKALIIDGEIELSNAAREAIQKLVHDGRAILFTDTNLKFNIDGTVLSSSPKKLLSTLDSLSKPDIKITPANPDLRYRHVIKNREHFYFLSNEGKDTITADIHVDAAGKQTWLNPFTCKETSVEKAAHLTLLPYDSIILKITV